MTKGLAQFIGSDPTHVHLGRFIAGVIYALQEYDHLVAATPKQRQTDLFYSNELQQLLSGFQTSTPPPRNWLRGFFYNAAAMRLDAAWERSLRVILKDTTKKGNLSTLYNTLRRSDEPTLAEFDKSSCKRVRDEVNDLKHRDQGPADDIREDSEILREGLKELLDLLRRRAP